MNVTGFSRYILAPLIVAIAGGCSVACATLSQDAASAYSRQQWTIEDGFRIGQVSSITQTSDGYLWIGGENGLVSFDGQQFRTIANSQQSTITHVLGLTTDAQGSLWIWMQGANVLRHHLDSFTNVSDEAGLPDANVTALARGADGAVLMSTLGQQVFEYKGGHVGEIGFTDFPNTLMLAIAKTRDGHVWIGTRDYGLCYLIGHKIVPASGQSALKKINLLLPHNDNTVWVGTDDGVLLWDGSQLQRVRGPASFMHAEILSLVEDRDGNLWAGTRDGLYRVSPFALGEVPTVTSYLDKQSITTLFEDREGDLWIGTGQTLQRWKLLPFHKFDLSTEVRGLSGGPVYVDEQGTGWAGSDIGGLYKINQGSAVRFAPEIFGPDVIYSLNGRKGDLWAARQNGGVTHLYSSAQGIKSETFTISNGLAQNSVFSIYEGQDGSVWAGTLSAGLSHYTQGRWRTFTTADGLPSNTISCLSEDLENKLWVGTPEGLAVLSQDRWRIFNLRDGLPSNDVTSILNDIDASGRPLVWIGTAKGLIVLRAGTIETVHSDADVMREAIWGITRDRAGFVWVSTPNHLARINREQLLTGEVNSSSIRLFGRMDGVDQVGAVRRSRCLVSDGAGNVWVSTAGGIITTNAGYMRHPPASTIVHIESMFADGASIPMNSAKVPGPHRRIVFNYSGLNFSVTERIQFRYRLDGYDKDWSDSTSDRQAVYTHLDPGSYNFRVIASNGEGGWNAAETSASFLIEPAFWQTWWFRLSSLAVLVSLVWGIYLLRVRQIAARANLLFEERLAERMRIAQDLHDTLLQSFHALMLRFQAVSNKLPQQPAEAKELLDTAIDRAAGALSESRDAVQKLRSRPEGSSDLVEALTRIGQELVGVYADEKVTPAFRVVVEGVSREINSMIRDDVYRVGREAIGNAFRHAQAEQIEVELRYETRLFALRVRDDGIGIDRNLLSAGGRDGHWGLPGMRERTEALGGRFTVWSEVRQGTEIEVAIPGAIAYSLSGSI